MLPGRVWLPYHDHCGRLKAWNILEQIHWNVVEICETIDSIRTGLRYQHRARRLQQPSGGPPRLIDLLGLIFQRFGQSFDNLRHETWNSWCHIQQSCLVHNISSCSILCSDLCRLQQAIWISQTSTRYKKTYLRKLSRKFCRVDCASLQATRKCHGDQCNLILYEHAIWGIFRSCSVRSVFVAPVQFLDNML